MIEKHKRALVLGCFGMDGSHMVDLLLSQRYYVVGLAKSFVAFKSHLAGDFKFIKGDIRDINLIEQIILGHNIEEIYNFAGITFSPFADSNPELTLEVNRNAPIKIAKLCQKHELKFIQASSSEIFGNVSDCTLDEKSQRNPHSPYSLAKYEVDQMMSELRNSGHKMYNAILFPHESERRRSEFLVRKICKGVADIHLGKIDGIQLGSIDSTRDWSSSKDFVYWMYLMTKAEPGEYVLASGELHSVKDVLDVAFEFVGITDWSNFIHHDQQLFRKIDRNNLAGDNSKIKLATGKSLNTGFESIVKDIVSYDLENSK